MPLILDDEQNMLASTVREFLADEGNIASQLRVYRDSNCTDGFGHKLWKRFAELGLTGIRIDEADGGLGLGHVEAGIVLEEIGRNLTPSPFLMSAVVAVEALRGSAMRAKWLPGIVAGDTVATLALDERAGHAPERIATRATRSGNGFRIDGAKQFVIQGTAADLVIVAARTAGGEDEREGITLFALEKDASGLETEGVRLVDSSIGARLRFDGVEVDSDAVIGEVDQGWEILSRTLAAGRVGAAAELTGLGTAAAGMTNAYLKERRQFGRLIGEFQALQHRAAHLYSELEIARAVVLKAAQALDAGEPEAETLVAAAKSKAGRAARLAVQEGVQMHGGIGMTDEHDIGLYMKRDRVLNELFGDSDFHADWLARMLGY